MQWPISRRPSTTNRPSSRRREDFCCSARRCFIFGFCVLEIIKTNRKVIIETTPLALSGGLEGTFYCNFMSP